MRNVECFHLMIYMKKLIFCLPLFLLAGIVVSACENTGSNDDNQDVERLYSETCRLTALYTDSMTKANDSSALSGLMKRFDERLTRINFSVKPETDYHLSEGMNDTISLLIDSLRRVYNERLYELAHPLMEKEDSINHDSL